MKLDPWKHQPKYEKWKKTKILKDISKYNADLIIEFLDDMERGYNVGRPGTRSYARLNNLKQRMRWMALQMEKAYKKEKITDLTKRDISDFFNVLMRKGILRTREGKAYTSIADYANVFKSFWHWYQRREDDQGHMVQDKTTYVDMSPVKVSEFVYLTIEDLRKLSNLAKFDYRVLMWFLFDSGIRAPTELMNIKVSDLSSNGDYFEVNIREETSKTFGRRIKLLLCSQLLKEYLDLKRFEADDGNVYIIDSVHQNIKEYINFREEIKSKFNILNMHENVILEELKREGFIDE